MAIMRPRAVELETEGAKMKRFFAVSMLGSAVALAMAATTVIGSFGQGHAMSADGRRSEFHFDVRKATNGSNVRLDGFARFIAFSGTQANPQSHGIVMPNVRVVGKQGNVCQFAGPAQMQIRNGAHYHLVRGHVMFNVADRHDRQTNTGQPDRISVRFTDLQNRTWDYTGLVGRGDLVVFERIID